MTTRVYKYHFPNSAINEEIDGSFGAVRPKLPGALQFRSRSLSPRNNPHQASVGNSTRGGGGVKGAIHGPDTVVLTYPTDPHA